jgi:hypothetical protein
MNDVPLHKLYRHYSEMPYSLRVLYTSALLVLGMAYLFALINLFHTYAGRAGGNPMIVSYKDILTAYTGTGSGSRLESALRGPMSTMLPQDDATRLIDWVHQGSNKATYESDIKPIMDGRCMSCHDGSNPHLPNLASYEMLKKVTEQDTGTDVFTLVRVSHIHLFGLTFVFFIVGLIYSHAYVRPVWLKSTIIAMPFVAICIDISSWYLTKLFHPFAAVVLLSGGLMGVCFAWMWITSMYQLWFGKPPDVVVQRAGAEGTVNVG